jgi:sec-independent protein translocase protein TatB
MASFGIQDSLFLMLLALVVFGPRRLPEIGRQIGKLMYEFRKVSNDFKFQMEEELRASEEADRQRKLQAAIPAAVPASTQPTSQAMLDVPPHPVSETASQLELGSGATNGYRAQEEAQVEMSDEVHGGQFPSIHPPTSGETIAAAKPFRGRLAEPSVENGTESVSESGSEPTHTASTPVMVKDEGRVGTEVQPGVNAEAEQDVHHA